ncbi:RWD domain-containing protein 2B-like [Patiria miniata]|uniref:RWD domain-containing protein n=1 Tax=Patiria miniata TaxID=46514 RepID=A0A913ZUG2_PATMI|nr:RWD domain-containing protein 2B-like [Patiria miniata]
MEKRELIELQLSEVEMLQSMFPNEEFCMDDLSVISEARNIVECDDHDDDHELEVEGLLAEFRQITFTIKIKIEEPQCDLQVICLLPERYPQDVPEVLVRSETPLFSRQQQKRLNDDVAEHILSLDRGELCIGEAIQWIRENTYKYVEPPSPSKDKSVSNKNMSKKTKEDDTFTRLWIHSHHIYSKFKRRDILDWGTELPVTGFCLPGKPGIICIEGEKSFAEEFWNRLRRMNWKKISCKHREDVPLCDGKGQSTSTSDLRRFSGFEEKEFAVSSGRDYHMDLGMFFKFLEEHNCGSVFKILLGVDGKVSSKAD